VRGRVRVPIDAAPLLARAGSGERSPCRPRRRAHAARAAALALISLTFVLGARPVSAQVTEPRDFPIERFRWTFARTGVLGAEWGGIPEAGSWDLGLWLGTSNDPLVLFRDEADGDRTVLTSLVAQRTAASLVLSYAPWRRLELGLELPLVLAQSRSEFSEGATGMLSSIAGAGLGDVRLAAKLGLLRTARHGIDVALSTSLSLPSGGGDDYRGERGVALAPELIVSRQLGRTRLAGNAGYRARQNARLLDLEVVDELFGVIALGQQLGAASRGLELSLGLSLATAAQSPTSSDNQDYAEAMAGATWDTPGPLVLALVGGFGLNQGFGTPDWRGVLAVRFGDVRAQDAARGPRPPPPPVASRPPAPPPDRDGDGLVDPRDACPGEAETVNGLKDDDGCPDQPDRDGDGLVAPGDLCPDEAEDLDGHQDDDGCPDPDNDGDGLADAMDSCPSAAGPAENRGCPDGDRDEDGVADRLDNCPDVAGTVANRGCAKRQLVALVAGKLELLDIVYFETAKDRILPRSFPLLDNVVAVLAAHPEIATVDVEGHTDDVGDDAYNKDLSQRRAASVVRYLESHGVRTGLLHPIGYGEERPVVDNKTPKSRARNRRVEFRLGVAPGASAPSAPGEKTYDFPDEVIESSDPRPRP
jgi:outer membrane protein OmpA-like peptidoglycan-associated protein